MADPESFLARWSRRKRDAASQEGNRSKPASVADESSPAATDTSMPDTSMPGDVEPPFDPACLPPLDSIGSGSDVRPFLAAGVPAELKRMALRRAWLTDPTIRDFIGLSENAWDFNTVGAAPGFGAIDEEAVRQLTKKIVGEPGADVALSSSAAARRDETTQPDDRSIPVEEVVAARGGPVAVPNQESGDRDEDCAAQRDGADAAAQAELRQHGGDRAQPRPRHGGALPK